MAFNPIQHNGKSLSLHKAITRPLFHEKTVLAGDPWEYVDLWLQRSKKSRARFYWEQAHSFYEAARILPKTSAPLPAYYCFLNAVKALLLADGMVYADLHGVTGWTTGDRASLRNENVRFKTSGVLPALCARLGEPRVGDYTLAQLLYNLPYIHRAYDLTFGSSCELFIPVAKPMIVRSTR